MPTLTGILTGCACCVLILSPCLFGGVTMYRLMCKKNRGCGALTPVNMALMWVICVLPLRYPSDVRYLIMVAAASAVVCVTMLLREECPMFGGKTDEQIAAEKEAKRAAVNAEIAAREAAHEAHRKAKYAKFKAKRLARAASLKNAVCEAAANEGGVLSVPNSLHFVSVAKLFSQINDDPLFLKECNVSEVEISPGKHDISQVQVLEDNDRGQIYCGLLLQGPQFAGLVIRGPKVNPNDPNVDDESVPILVGGQIIISETNADDNPVRLEQLFFTNPATQKEVSRAAEAAAINEAAAKKAAEKEVNLVGPLSADEIASATLTKAVRNAASSGNGFWKGVGSVAGAMADLLRPPTHRSAIIVGPRGSAVATMCKIFGCAGTGVEVEGEGARLKLVNCDSTENQEAGVIAYGSGAVATLLLFKPIGEGYDSDSDDETRFSDNGLFDLAVVGGAKLVVEAGMKGEKKVAEADRLKARVVMLEDMEEKFWEDDTLSCVSDA